MGQKVNPNGYRIGVVRRHNSHWYAKGREYSRLLLEDIKIREYLEEKLANASVGKIEIDRNPKRIKITVHSARPGVIIKRRGEGAEELRADIETQVSAVDGEKPHIVVDVAEITKPDLNANLQAKGVAQQIERRVMYRRAMKRCMTSAMNAGAVGIKVQVSGRLSGAEIARREWYLNGRVPLHTIKADIDYACVQAKTTYGIIGIKVWLCKGEVSKKDMVQAKAVNVE